MAPRFSVVVPCFNLGRWLGEALESVRAQTVPDWEICVVDDGSDDPETVRVLDALDLPRTTLARTPNRGLAAARNLGAERTTGAYLCFLDADDVLAPAYLERTGAALDADPNLGFVSTWQRTFGDEAWDWRRDRCDLPALLAEDTVHTAALVRREALRQAGGFDGGMGAMGYEDWDLWLSLVERGWRGTVVPETLFYYRRRGPSMYADCTRPDVHARIFEYVVRKHEASYRRHLLDVLALKEVEGAALLAENHRLEQELAGPLELMRRGLADEVARLRAKAGPSEAEALRARVAELERYAKGLEAELAALRASASWQVTAPLRAAYDALGLARRRR